MSDTPSLEPHDSPIHVAHFTPTFSEALEATWYVWLRALRKVGISIALLALILLYMAITHADGSVISFFAVFSASIVGLVLFLFSIVFLVSAFKLSRPKDPDDCSGYTFSADGVDVSNNMLSARINWAAIHDFSRSARLLMFKPFEKKSLLFIPLRCVSEKDLVRLEKLLADRSH